MYLLNPLFAKVFAKIPVEIHGENQKSKNFDFKLYINIYKVLMDFPTTISYIEPFRILINFSEEVSIYLCIDFTFEIYKFFSGILCLKQLMIG